ncbi:uncharacterized protein LOC132734885 [Ruditapes philippinarum]|uniref:uncharacterized protein LOC132734885 n=1 Tax=Ruditapes philippinarum TaxID=129788 RepID=UPI00295AE220|nr:uncharacterized protein LOC132734885 [Ruditapes philippinarum]
MLMKATVLMGLVVVGVNGQVKRAEYMCHGDLCNVGDKPQFCSETFKLCRNCEDIKEECGTASQPRNCTQYCQDLAVERAITKNMKENEDSCIVLPMLLNIAHGNAMLPPYNGSRITSGSAIVYRCDVDYRLEGTDTIVCLGNDSWNQTALPYCSDLSWIGFKRAIIALSIAIFVLCIIIGIILVYRHCKKGKGQGMSRSNTDSSFESREIVKPLLAAEDQCINNEVETLKMSALNDESREQNESNKTPVVPTVPAAPSAPPLDEQKDGKQMNASSLHDGNRQSDDNGNANGPYDNIPRKNDAEGIDEKRGTEESVDSTAAERGTGSNIHNDIGMAEENARGKKGKGTKPLPGRTTEKVSVGKGPQVIAAKRDSITPTKETEQDDVSKNIGIGGATFQNSDIKGKGMQTEITNKEGIESAIKESGLDDSSAKVGFDKRTFPASDMKMNELKVVD